MKNGYPRKFINRYYYKQYKQYVLCTWEILNEISKLKIVVVYYPQENGGKTYDQFTIDQQLKVSSRHLGKNVVEKEEKGARNDYLPHKGDIHSISTKVSE